MVNKVECLHVSLLVLIVSNVTNLWRCLPIFQLHRSTSHRVPHRLRRIRGRSATPPAPPATWPQRTQAIPAPPRWPRSSRRSRSEAVPPPHRRCTSRRPGAVAIALPAAPPQLPLRRVARRALVPVTPWTISLVKRVCPPAMWLPKGNPWRTRTWTWPSHLEWEHQCPLDNSEAAHLVPPPPQPLQ